MTKEFSKKSAFYQQKRRQTLELLRFLFLFLSNKKQQQQQRVFRICIRHVIRETKEKTMSFKRDRV